MNGVLTNLRNSLSWLVTYTYFQTIHMSSQLRATDVSGTVPVLRQFSHALEKCEVTAIEADGKPFDPNQHEAIGQKESDAPAGSVVEVLQKGYKLADRLLRPALVIVARAKPEAAPDAATEGA